eukprot:4391014-Amphidinium_carterae.1
MLSLQGLRPPPSVVPRTHKIASCNTPRHLLIHTNWPPQNKKLLILAWTAPWRCAPIGVLDLRDGTLL